MKMNKDDMLGALKAMKVDNGPKNTESFTKTDFLKNIGGYMPKADGKGQYKDDSSKKLNSDLAKPEKEIKFESNYGCKLQQSDIKNVSQKFLAESAILENSSPNAFRLDLGSLVLDKTHAKVGLTRAGEKVRVELMYPNANDKITVKITVDGVEDKIYELSLEDEAYVGNFGSSILKEIDSMIKEKESMGIGDYDDEYYIGNKSGGLTGFAPSWETGGNVTEAAVSRMKDLMALVEADDEEKDKTATPDVDVEGEGEEFDAGDVNADENFSESDFSLDDAGDVNMDEFNDLGASMGGGGALDLGGGNDFGGGDVNAEKGDSGVSVEENVNFMTFREKSDWLNSALDSMQKLVAKSVADKMQDGEGVILTSDEILNGSVGIKNDSNPEIIEKFLKVYPSLDEIEFKEEDLNRIEEKLSLDDGQFDAWLQAELPEMRGDKDVSDTLDNDMFDDFEEMGGEQPDEFGGLGEFDDFVDETTSDEGDIDSLFADIAAEPTIDEEEEEDTEARKEAENEVGGEELNEFPNV